MDAVRTSTICIVWILLGQTRYVSMDDVGTNKMCKHGYGGEKQDVYSMDAVGTQKMYN